MVHTILRHAAVLHAGTGRGVVHVLSHVLLCVLLFAPVAPSLPVRPRVPNVKERVISQLLATGNPQQKSLLAMQCTFEESSSNYFGIRQT